MKKIYLLFILVFFGCIQKDTNKELPSFKGNYDLNDIWLPIKEIVIKKKFSVVYSEGGSPFIKPGDLTHKIFCLDEKQWQKIEIRRGITDTDTVNNDIEIIEKDITLKKDCTDKESRAFLDSLIHFNLFVLDDENAITKRCKETGGRVTKTHDASRVTFYLIHKNNVRMLTFYDLDQKSTDCPNVHEIKEIQKIIRLFKNQWYLR